MFLKNTSREYTVVVYSEIFSILNHIILHIDDRQNIGDFFVL